MKIVIDARILDRSSGIGRYIQHLLEELQKLDHTNSYIVLLQKHNFSLWHPTAPNFSKQIADFRHFSLSEQIKFCILLYRLKPDLVHFTNFNHPVLYLRRRIITVHDLTLVKHKNIRSNKIKYAFKYWAFRFVLRHGVYSSFRIITISDYVRKQILSRYHIKSRKVSVIYPAVDELSTAAKEIPSLRNKKFLLYVGAAYPFKNLKRLILAFSQLSKTRPDLVLVLAGKSDEFYDGLKKLVQAKKIQNVIFTGFVRDNELIWLYKNASLYAFPSLSEGFGLPGLEAMQYGLPVASSDATCLKEVYENSAYYFDPHDVNDISAKLLQLLNSQELRQELRELGYKQVKKYSWSTLGTQTLELYKSAKK